MTSALDSLGSLCWPYKGLPPDLLAVAKTEAQADLTSALEDLRKPDASAELRTYALRRIERSRDYGREPVDLHVDICIELWRLLQDRSVGYGLRRKSVSALQQKLRLLRKQYLPGRGLEPMPQQRDADQFARLRKVLSWRVLQETLLGELERSHRGAPVEPRNHADQLAEALAGLVNEVRHWTDLSEAGAIIESLSKRFDPNQRSIVLLGRLMLMAMPTEAAAKCVEDGSLTKWLDLLPRGSNSRYSLMWIVLPGRAAKVRWASGNPWNPEPVLSRSQLGTLLDSVAGTMCLPVDGGRQCDMDSFTEDCQWAFLGKTTYRLVAKFFVYALEPLKKRKPDEPFAEGSVWAALQMLCRRLAACTINKGSWTWHVRIFLCELSRCYYVRACRERFREPGCRAHDTCRLTAECDRSLVRMLFPLLMDTFQLQSGVQEHMTTGTTTALSFVSRLALLNADCWEEIQSFLEVAIQDLQDPMSIRHASTLHLLTNMTPLLVYVAPGLVLEGAGLALPGIDSTDPLKTVVAAQFFVNLFVQVPSLDLSGASLPDEMPSVITGALPLLDKGGKLVAGATVGDLQIATSMLPDLCTNLLDRFLEYVPSLPKPSKKDAMAAMDMAGPRLLSTALFLAVRQADAKIADSLAERLADWVSLTLMPSAVKAIGMLVGAFTLAYPGTADKIIDKALKKLPVNSGSLANLGESEVLWHLYMIGSAARFAGSKLTSRKAALEERFLAAVSDKRKAVRKAGAKLTRRVLFGLTAPYTGDLTGDGTLQEALSRWAGARSMDWGSPLRPLKFHSPSAEEVAMAHGLVDRSLELIRAKAAGSDEDIHTALSLMKSLHRGVACLYPDEREGENAAPMVSSLPNALGPRLLKECSEVLLALCPRLGSPGHPFESSAEVSGRPNLLCKAMRMLVGIVHGERRPEIPDLFQIRGFDGGNVRNNVSSESFTQKAHFMSAWRDLSRVWYNWEVLSLMNRRLHHRPTGFKYEGLRRKMAELLCGYTMNANSLVSVVATECLTAFLKVHYSAKRCLLEECFLPMQEKTIRGVSSLDSEKAHIAEAALQGFARCAARLFVVGSWRRGVAHALKIATAAVRIVHAFTEEGKLKCDVRPSAIGMQFEVIAKWASSQAAATPGDAAEACKMASELLNVLKVTGTHWRTKVCVLASAGPALRVLQATDAAAGADVGTLRQWIADLLSRLAFRGHPQMASIAVAELTTALRAAMTRPTTPLATVLAELLPKDGDFLVQVAKTLSGLHQGHMGSDAGAPAQADAVQCMVTAAAGRSSGVPHLAWAPCPVGRAWTSHAAFFQSYVRFRAHRGDAGLVEELRQLFASLHASPKSELEDHVVFIEVLAGAARASRRWSPELQKSFWAAVGPVAAQELLTAEEDNVRDWQYLVYYALCGVSRRLRPVEKPSEDQMVLNLASFLCGSHKADAPPALATAPTGEAEASSHAHATRLRLLQVLVVCLQRRSGHVSDNVREVVVKGLLPAAQAGVSHPFKQVHEESAKALVMALSLNLQFDCLGQLRTWVKQRASDLAPAVCDAGKDSDVSKACEGLVYVFLHGLLGRRLRGLSLECADLLFSAASADDAELRALAGLAITCLGRSPQRRLEPEVLARRAVELCQTRPGEDPSSAKRSRRLEASVTHLGAVALRHDFSLRLATGEPGKVCRDRIIELLGDKRLDVQLASQAALAPLLGLETSESCKQQAKAFLTLPADGSVDRAVHGLSAMLRAAGSLGVPPWLGTVIEALSKVGRRPEGKKEVEKTVQAFLKQQQASRDLWKRCQTRLTEEQMDLLKARQGTMSYYS